MFTFRHCVVKRFKIYFFNLYHFSFTLCNIGLMSEIGFAFYVQFRTLQMQMIEQVLQGFYKHSEHPWLKWKQCCQLWLSLQKFSLKLAKPIYTSKIEVRFQSPLMSFEAFWRKSDIILDHVQFLHFENSCLETGSILKHPFFNTLNLRDWIKHILSQ